MSIISQFFTSLIAWLRSLFSAPQETQEQEAASIPAQVRVMRVKRRQAALLPEVLEVWDNLELDTPDFEDDVQPEPAPAYATCPQCEWVYPTRFTDTCPRCERVEAHHEAPPTPFYEPVQLDMTQEVQLVAAMPLVAPEPDPLPPSNPDVPTVPVALVVAGDNDRTAFEPVALQELADSIQGHGLAQPITVRPMPDGKYQIIAGERRFRAVCLLGWADIPALVRDLSDEAAAGIMLVENLHRADLNPIDEARAYQKRIDQFAWNVKDLAHFGKVNAARVKSRLELLRLKDDVQALIQSGNLGIGYAECMTDLDANRQALAMRYFSQAKRPTIAEFRGLCSQLLEAQSQDALFDVSKFMQVAAENLIAELQAAKVKRYPTKDTLPTFTKAQNTGLALERYIALLMERGLTEDAATVGTVLDGLIGCGLARQAKDSPLVALVA